MRPHRSPDMAETRDHEGKGGRPPKGPQQADSERRHYTCQMHPEVVQNKPGTCPICGMGLVPGDMTVGPQTVHQQTTGSQSESTATSHEHSARRQQDEHSDHAGGQRPYLRLAVMAILSFIAMYALMFAMVNALGNVYLNVNQFYMAGLMAAPMVIIELLLMASMYRNKRLNAAILAGTVLAVAGFWILIRQQTLVGDKQFLRSMIPHHAGAILMCEKAPIRDPEIKRLCESIKSSQQAEIDWMKAKLMELQ